MTRARLFRTLCALLGAAAWVRLWVSPSAESPRTLFVLWLAAILLWSLAWFSRWPVPRLGRNAGVVAGVIALALVPRLLALSQAPFLVAFDEVIEPSVGVETLAAHPWEIFSGTSSYFSQTNLISVLQAWPCLFTEPLFGSRLASVLLSVLSLVGTYALAQRLFGRGVALVALLVLAGSYWHMLYSRLAHPYMQPIALVPCTLYLLAVGMERRNAFLLFVAGAFVALSLLAYTPARVVAPIAAVWILHRVVTTRPRWRDVIVGSAAIALGLALVYTPQLRSHGAEDLFRRFQEAAANEVAPLAQIRKLGWLSAGGLGILARQFARALSPYFTSGGLMAVGDFSPAPLLDPATLALALIGYGLCAARLADSRRFLLLVWITAPFLIGQVFTDMPAAAYRAAPMLPALAIAAGLGARGLVACARHWPALRHPAMVPAAWVALAVAILPPNVQALTAYVAARRSSLESAVARLIRSGSAAANYYVVGPDAMTASTVLRFLTPGKHVHDVPNLMDSLGQTIDAQRDAVFIVQPELAAAAAVIRRCYPRSVVAREFLESPDSPMTVVTVPAAQVAAGRNCKVPPQGPGLRARYFSGPAWDGPLVLDHVEDWPLRFRYDAAFAGSVEWSGVLHLPMSGKYQFQLYTMPPAVAAAEIEGLGRLQGGSLEAAELLAGPHAITVRCRPNAPGGFCWLRWCPPLGAFSAIPARFLRPPRQLGAAAAP